MMMMMMMIENTSAVAMHMSGISQISPGSSVVRWSQRENDLLSVLSQCDGAATSQNISLYKERWSGQMEKYSEEKQSTCILAMW